MKAASKYAVKMLKPTRKAPNKPLVPSVSQRRANATRARRAQLAIKGYKVTHDLDRDTATDVLTDLMHWCDKNRQDFATILNQALDHYAEETNYCGSQFRRIYIKAEVTA